MFERLEITRSATGRTIKHPTGIEQLIELDQLKEFRRQTQLEIDMKIIQRAALDSEIAEITSLRTLEVKL